MIKIIQKDQSILRNTAKLVPLEKIGTEEINSIIRDMTEAMNTQKDGIALAAPQIGVSLQIFLVKGQLLKQADPTYKGDENNLVFINPEIIKISKKKKEVEEGCLSVRWLYGKVKRANRITITAYNEKGEKIERGAGGILAQIFQHEIDHLNGILFTDKAKEVWEMTEKEIKELTN